jgi:hypothetical protein
MAANRMVGFGYKTAWWAIRDGQLPAVLTALGGQLVGQVTWPEGIQQAYRERDIVIVTPPLAGADGSTWLLIAGSWIASNYEAPDVATLSAALDREVQLFATHRVVEWHRWERARDGVTLRSFEYADGAVRRWQGTVQEAELAIGLTSTVGDPDVKESNVMRIAAAWSVDPTSLDGMPATADLSLVRLPTPVNQASVPDRPGGIVDITDIIASGMPYKEAMKQLKGRLRRARRR